MAINTLEQIDVEQALRNDLSQYLCGSIWNHPLTELRRNITLRAISRGRCVKHICDIGSTYVELPNIKYNGQSHEYYVYAAACCCMGGLIVDCEQVDVLQLEHFGEWVRLDKYLNIRPFDLRIHSIYGEWLNRNCIFIKNHPTEDMFLIAIDQRMADKILGPDYNFTTMYMSVYYDSDNNVNNLYRTSPTIFSEYMQTQEQINTLFERYSSINHDNTLFFINGRLSYPSSLLDITIGDYTEMVYDPDVIANIQLDMVNDRDSHVYRSSVDGTYKYIIHIPKSKNPENLIITHNTCDVFISPLNTSPVVNANLKGLFVHRFDTSYRTYQYVETTDTVFRKGRDYYLFNTETNSYVQRYVSENEYGKNITEHLFIRATSYLSDHLITQITHNDFGISEKLLQPYMDIIGSSECSIRVIIRKHQKSNKLDRDCNFIKFLYKFDDATILNFLNGNLQAYCPFWKAENLEISEWAKVLFEVPSQMYEESTKHFIDALGYYNSACVIAPRVTSGLYNPQNTHALDFTIPRSMLTNKGIDSLFTINGKLLRKDKYIDIAENQYLHFDIDESVPIERGDQLVAEMFEKKIVRAEYFTPTSNSPSFTIPEDSVDLEFDLYLVKDNCTLESDYFIDHYVDTTNLKGYKKVDNIGEYINLPLSETPAEVTVNQSCVDTGCTNPAHYNSKKIRIVTSKTMTFKPVAFDKEFLIVSKNIYNRYTEIDMQQCGGNTKLGTLHNPDNTRTCSDLLHSGKLLVAGRKWTRDELIKFPIINNDWSIIPFCNGRELIKNVDYSEVTLKDSEGYIAYKTCLFAVGGLGSSQSINDSQLYYDDSYLKYDNNEFDLIVTDDKIFSRLNGFSFTSNYFGLDTPNAIDNECRIEDILAIIYWFDELNKLVVDGKSIYRPETESGIIKFTGEYRNGALYGSRGVIPSVTAKFIDKYKDNMDDLEKIAKIIKYIRSLNQETTEENTIISHSHHLTSITTNCLIKDVITGAKELYWTSARNQIEEQIAEYKSMFKYDPIVSGAVKDIFVTASGTDMINDRYHLVELSASGHDRIWINTNNRCSIEYSTSNHRWEILVNTIFGKKVYYYATADNELDPWNLGWARNEGEAPVPVIINEGIDKQFIDAFPSYTSDEHEADEDIMLRRCVDVLLPPDAIKDGATTL